MDMLAPLEQADAAAFDYGSLPAETAPRQRERAERIRGMYRQTVETAGEIGRELLAAQAEMDHGLFLPWVTGAVGLTKSTAYRCMDMARSFGAKLPTVGSLPLAVVHKLSEKSTPEPVRAALLRRIEAGETIQADKILDEVREARELAKAAATAEREAVRRAALSDERREQEDALRAKGERGRAARERKEARERDERRAERQREAAEISAAACALVDMLGPDRAAAYFARFGAVASQAQREAENEAHRRRARATDPVELPAHQIDTGASYEWFGDEHRARLAAIAAEIGDADPKELPIAVRDETDRRRPYRIVEGAGTIRALVDVLGRPAVKVRIAPPPPDIPLTAPAALKPSRPIIGIRSGTDPQDHFGELHDARSHPAGLRT